MCDNCTNCWLWIGRFCIFELILIIHRIPLLLVYFSFLFFFSLLPLYAPLQIFCLYRKKKQKKLVPCVITRTLPFYTLISNSFKFSNKMKWKKKVRLFENSFFIQKSKHKKKCFFFFVCFESLLFSGLFTLILSSSFFFYLSNSMEVYS